MASFSHSVEVARSPDEVFPWLLEEDRVPRWTGELESYRNLDGGPVRQGSRLLQVLEIGGSRFEVELEVTRYEPPRAAESRFTTNGVEIVNVYTLEAVGTGARLTQSMDAQPKSFGARMVIPVVRGRLERKLTDDLERLRALLEAPE